jgi:lysozyme
MRYSPVGFYRTKSHEACKLTAYLDQGGIWTIGWGHTRGVMPGQTITMEEAENFLHQDMLIAENAVDKFVKVPLNQNEYDALVDFCFNVGIEHFLQSTLLKLVNEGNFLAAADEMLKWDHVKGKVSAGLLRRRTEEKLLFENDEKTAST